MNIPIEHEKWGVAYDEERSIQIFHSWRRIFIERRTTNVYWAIILIHSNNWNDLICWTNINLLLKTRLATRLSLKFKPYLDFIQAAKLTVVYKKFKSTDGFVTDSLLIWRKWGSKDWINKLLFVAQKIKLLLVVAEMFSSVITLSLLASALSIWLRWRCCLLGWLHFSSS